MSTDTTITDGEKGSIDYVVKFGTQVLSNGFNFLDEIKIQTIAQQMHKEKAIIVSSGAALVGYEYEQKNGKTDFPELTFEAGEAEKKQVALRLTDLSGKGTHLLGAAYQLALISYERPTVYHVVTGADFHNTENGMMGSIRRNLRDNNLVVLNMNDPADHSELDIDKNLHFDDNDKLAYLVASTFSAKELVLVTESILHDKNPSEYEGAVSITDYDIQNAPDLDLLGKTNVGRGGMESKIEACTAAVKAGIPTRLITWNEFAGQGVHGQGTLFYDSKNEAMMKTLEMQYK